MDRLFAILLFVAAVVTYQVVGVSATATQQADGSFALVITGDAGMIAQICARGCEGRYGSRVDAANGFLALLGQASGTTLVPIPTATSP